ncbi:MAG: polyphosphate polymerase domain-containing protein [Clostridia bacterium]|nr:polyphosphate polymerase domain-containing protein [Clostridia bacterium]
MSELSVFRTENKYLLNFAEASQLRARLDKLLKKDKYSQNGAYVVRSLYLDTVENSDYHEKLAGTEIRKKIRIRSYSPDDEVCKLEIKQKNGDLQHKVSLLISREDAVEISRGNFSVMFDYFDKSPNAAYIYSELCLGIYRPVALIEYDRIAYMHELYSTRITFDMNVRSNESYFDLFDTQPIFTPVFDNMVVLEVKYNGVLLDSISKALEPFNLTRTSVSKYCLGRKIYFDL